MNLSALSAIGPGFQQGIGNNQNLQGRAIQIAQSRMALEQAQRQLQADAAAFSGMGAPPQGGASGFVPALPGAQSQPMAQPMAPGQASVPTQRPEMPQQSGMQPPPMAQPGAEGMPAQPPGAPQQQMGGGGTPGQLDPTDPRAAVQTVMQIASEIKARNPNIDGPTLMLATSRVIDLSKGLAPALRQGAQVVIQDMKNQQSGANTALRVGAQENIAGKNIDSRENIAGMRDETTRRGQDIGLERAREQAGAAMQRAQFNQGEMTKRVQSGQVSKERGLAYTERVRAATSKLNQAQRQLSSLQASLTAADDPRSLKAQQDVQAAVSELDRVDKAIGIEAAPVAPKAAQQPAGGPAPAARPTATDAKGNKVEWDGKAWVPVKG